MLTLVASSIISASWPITQGPKLSPRSQLRSTVFIGLASLQVSLWVLGQRASLPGLGIDRTDGAARNIGSLQRLDVELNAFDSVEAVRQGAQQLRELPCFRLRFPHADGFEAERGSGGQL